MTAQSASDPGGEPVLYCEAQDAAELPFVIGHEDRAQLPGVMRLGSRTAWLLQWRNTLAVVTTGSRGVEADTLSIHPARAVAASAVSPGLRSRGERPSE